MASAVADSHHHHTHHHGRSSSTSPSPSRRRSSTHVPDSTHAPVLKWIPALGVFLASAVDIVQGDDSVQRRRREREAHRDQRLELGERKRSNSASLPKLVPQPQRARGRSLEEGKRWVADDDAIIDDEDEDELTYEKLDRLKRGRGDQGSERPVTRDSSLADGSRRRVSRYRADSLRDDLVQ